MIRIRPVMTSNAAEKTFITQEDVCFRLCRNYVHQWQNISIKKTRQGENFVFPNDMENGNVPLSCEFNLQLAVRYLY